ncbi:MAG: hypothetical protein ACOYKQ_03560 [Polymorphobacter sp.]
MKIFVTGLAALLVVSSAAAQGTGQDTGVASFAFGAPQRNDLPGAYGLRFNGMIVSIGTPAGTYVELPLDCGASQSKEKTSGVLIQCRMRAPNRGANFITEHRCDRASIAASDVIVPDCAVTVYSWLPSKGEFTGTGRTGFDNIKMVGLFWSRN